MVKWGVTCANLTDEKFSLQGGAFLFLFVLILMSAVLATDASRVITLCPN